MKKLFFILVLYLFTSYGQNPLPTQTSSLFSGSGNCQVCHNSNGTSVLTYNGIDISPATNWRSTMMANASKDPLWRAVVAAEGIEFPLLVDQIETTCTKCHSPIGHTQAKYDGHEFFTVAELNNNPLANDGVSCTVCHQIDPENLGTDSSYSGGYIIKPVDVIYGPYENPLTGPMVMQTGYTPVFSTHVNKSELCATCHTLFTPFFNSQNQVAGYFPEQTPYIEWKNSIYQLSGIECQSCHMPRIEEGIDISTTPPWHQVLRSPYWRHDFAGGNVYMCAMLKTYAVELGLTSGAAELDSTIKKSKAMLQEKTVALNLVSRQQNDTVYTEVTLTNLTGHKLPTGIPFRRMWIHLTAEKETGAIVFESGKWDSHGEIIGIDSIYEPHHDIITDGNRVQIYEPVLMNTENELTYTLLRAAGFFKDNRLPPIGFKSSHISYDSVAVYGVNDPNFNRNSTGQEGSGSDRITYIFTNNYTGTLKIKAEVCYQTVKPEFIEHLTSLTDPDINAFKGMYDNMGNAPTILTSFETMLTVTGIKEDGQLSAKSYGLSAYPNPFNPDSMIRFEIPGKSYISLELFDIRGKKLADVAGGYYEGGSHEVLLKGENLAAGVYIVTMRVDKSKLSQKMVMIK